MNIFKTGKAPYGSKIAKNVQSVCQEPYSGRSWSIYKTIVQQNRIKSLQKNTEA